MEEDKVLLESIAAETLCSLFLCSKPASTPNKRRKISAQGSHVNSVAGKSDDDLSSHPGIDQDQDAGNIRRSVKASASQPKSIADKESIAHKAPASVSAYPLAAHQVPAANDTADIKCDEQLSSLDSHDTEAHELDDASVATVSDMSDGTESETTQDDLSLFRTHAAADASTIGVKRTHMKISPAVQHGGRRASSQNVPSTSQAHTKEGVQKGSRRTAAKALPASSPAQALDIAQRGSRQGSSKLGQREGRRVDGETVHAAGGELQQAGRRRPSSKTKQVGALTQLGDGKEEASRRGSGTAVHTGVHAQTAQVAQNSSRRSGSKAVHTLPHMVPTTEASSPRAAAVEQGVSRRPSIKPVATTPKPHTADKSQIGGGGGLPGSKQKDIAPHARRSLLGADQPSMMQAGSPRRQPAPHPPTTSSPGTPQGKQHRAKVIQRPGGTMAAAPQSDVDATAPSCSIHSSSEASYGTPRKSNSRQHPTPFSAQNNPPTDTPVDASPPKAHMHPQRPLDTPPSAAPASLGKPAGAHWLEGPEAVPASGVQQVQAAIPPQIRTPDVKKHYTKVFKPRVSTITDPTEMLRTHPKGAMLMGNSSFIKTRSPVAQSPHRAAVRAVSMLAKDTHPLLHQPEQQLPRQPNAHLLKNPQFNPVLCYLQQKQKQQKQQEEVRAAAP